jgi:hypothetical protein
MKILTASPLHKEVSKNLQQNSSTMADKHNGMMAS